MHAVRLFHTSVIGSTLLTSLVLLLSANPAAAQKAQLLSPVVPITGEAAQQPIPGKDQPEEKKGKEDLFKLDLEKLLQVPVAPASSGAPISLQQQVSSVSRQESTVAHSPTAIFVITQDMIRRSGATTIMEALRMVPGLNVARVNSSTWAISSRGFNDLFANKMLVQIDGRTVFNPIFSGVYWDNVDLLLQDVERIEVIRGPGATVWGANAVNGVINITTKSARDTQGSLITGGGGSFDQGMGGFRHGGKLGDDLYYRVWGKWTDTGRGFNSDGLARDNWQQGRFGIRFDWLVSERDTFTLQGDMYREAAGVYEVHPTPFPQGPPTLISSYAFPVTENRHFQGADILWRWTHKIDKDSDWRLQIYYDNISLRSTTVGELAVNTFDLDFQHQFPLTARQQIIYGFGYRLNSILFRGSFSGDFQTNAVPPGFQVAGFPPNFDQRIFSAFVQDQITLVKDKLNFTGGVKFEHNSYANFEFQPTGRLLWTPTEKQSIWAAVSRAVRTPNYQEEGIANTLRPSAVTGAGIPVFPRILPNPSFLSEDVVAYEVGYRAQPTDSFSFDVATFINDYRHLRVTVPGGPLSLPGFNINSLQFQNAMVGDTYGAEVAANWKVSEYWRLYGAYTFLNMQLRPDSSLPAATQTGAVNGSAHQSPSHQVYLQSSWDLGCHWEFDLIGRYVDALTGFNPIVPSYFSLDARLAWKPRPGLEFSVVGQNLLQAHHTEFGTNPLVGRPTIEIPRGVYGMMTYRW